MCGIVGVLRFDGEHVPHDVIRSLNSSLVHRGPDDDGVFVEGPAALAMRRLSIIDLANGHQPMSSRDGRYVIVFNGEVYNYKEVRASLMALGHHFQTNSDTEVVLVGYQEWGPDVLTRLLGMWGVAIYDTKEHALFLARDRVGKKQIYYGLTRKFLVFGSEMMIPMRYSSELRRLNHHAVPEFLRHGYVGVDQSPVVGVVALPPGHWVKVDASGVMHEQTYWSIHGQSASSAPRNEEEAAEQGFALIVDAIRYRLVSDVPISVMLSSGLDSSALAFALAKELRVPLQTFSLGVADDSFDESRDAGRFAEALGLPWQSELVSGRDVYNDFPSMIAHMSSLQSNTAQILYYYVNRMIRRAGYKVALNGNGGDELFAGYPTYRATRLFAYYRHLPGLLRRGLRDVSERVPASLGRVAFDYKLKKFTEIGELSPAAAHGYWRTMFSPVELRSVLRKDVFAELSTHTSLYERTFDGLNEDMDRPSIIGLLKADMLAWLQPMLPWADNMSMAHSVELRFPLLDHRLLEFAYSLSERHVFRGWSLKRIMRRMLRNRLPHEVLSRGKRGTHLPIGRWLNADLAPVADEYLSPQRLRHQRLFDEGTVAQLVSDHRSGRRDNTFKLWNLIVFSAWLEHYEVATI